MVFAGERLMKPAQGFITETGVFFELAEEAAFFEARLALLDAIKNSTFELEGPLVERFIVANLDVVKQFTLTRITLNMIYQEEKNDSDLSKATHQTETS